ncbi:MAG: hypothetical protein QM778_09000 [Myxococcales bacterium]
MQRRPAFSRSLMTLSLLSWITGIPAAALADGLPLSKSVQAGKPLHPLKITVEGAGPVVVTANGKRHEVPLHDARGASVEVVPLAGDAAVTLVHVEGANANWAMLLGGRAGNSVLASGKSDWTGDPGERRMFSIEAIPAEGPQGARSVRFGTRYEGLSQCSGKVPLIGAKRVDPVTLEAAVDVPNFPTGVSQDIEVAALAIPGAQPVLAGLEPAGSSRVDESTGFYLLPRTALDGKADSRWSLGPGEFATLRWTQRSITIDALELDLVPTGPAPTSVVLLADGDRVMRVPLTPSAPASGLATPATGAATAPAGTVRVAFKAPLTTRCLALLSDNLAPGASLGVQEVRAYTELDKPGSVERLVSLLVQDGESGASAADLLAALGDRGALAVAARFEELSARGKRRGLRVLAKGLEQPAVLARVTTTAREGDRELSEQALTVLQAGGEAGRTGLRELALAPGELGDTAAKLLVQRPGEIPTLLGALSAEGGSERPGLRSALTLAARREPAAFTGAVEAWLSATPSVPARSSLAIAAASAEARGLALKLAEPAWTSQLEFPERYRFASALAAADASPEADAWLEQQGGSAGEWMMRRVAFESLRARDPARADKLAEALASDAYPRVRAATLDALARGPGWTRAAQMGREDSWPLVRAAGARALSAQPEARAQLEGMLTDASERVRVAAIDSLTSLQAKQAWPAIEARMKSPDDSPDVHVAAIGFARELCVSEAREWLINEVRRALRPDAGDESARVGVDALHALHDLGGQAALDAKNLAARPETPPGLAKAYGNFRASRCEKAP